MVITIPKEAYIYFASEIRSKLWGVEPKSAHIFAEGKTEFHFGGQIAILEWGARADFIHYIGDYSFPPYDNIENIEPEFIFSLIDENGNIIQEDDFSDREIEKIYSEICDYL